MQRSGRHAAAALILGAFACGCTEQELARSRSAVINGADDRLEAFQVPEPVRTAIVGASAALVYSHHLRETAPDAIALAAPAAGAARGLCADEPFATQPSAAFCSGVVIDENLVATARHCLGTDADVVARRCRDLRVVFGYALSAAAVPLELRAGDVFACRRVVALDGALAVIELDRPPAAPVSPRPVAARGAAVGDALVVASYGAGLPLKIELAAAVTAVAPGSGDITVAMDTFAGSSGGGVFNADLELVALVSSGDVDWEVIGGCTRSAHSAVPREQASAAGALPDIVCGAGWPSARLCGTAPVCGDGVCSAGEAAACAGDCPPPRCGDALCEPPERGSCAEDCARYAFVPDSWLGDPAAYPSPDAGTDGGPRAASDGCAVAPGSARPVGATPPWLAMAPAAAVGLHRRRRRVASRRPPGV